MSASSQLVASIDGIRKVDGEATRAMLDRVCQLIEEVVPAAPRGLVAQTIDVCVHLRRDPLARAGRSLTGLERVVGVARDGGWAMEPIA